MRTGTKFLCALAAILGLLAGVFVFFPWDAVAGCVIDGAAADAARSGIYVTVADKRTEGFFRKTVVCRGVRADFPVFSVVISELRVTPHIISSVSGNEKFDVETGAGFIAPMVGGKVEWNASGAKVSRGADSTRMDDIHMTGKTSMSGFIEIFTAKRSIKNANLDITTSGMTDTMLNMISKTGLLPLKRVDKGRWKVER